MPIRVEWRDDGHQLRPEDPVAILRFEVSDLNQVMKSAVAASPSYVPLLEACGLTPRDRLLPLSCFAVTQTWTPSRLARTTHYKHYRQVAASVLLDAGYREKAAGSGVPGCSGTAGGTTGTAGGGAMRGRCQNHRSTIDSRRK